MKTRILTALAIIFLAGCAPNGFQKYYQPTPHAASIRVEPFSGEPAIYTYSDDPKADARRAYENGYVLLGSSSFYGPGNIMTRDELIAQAKNVGAAMVLVHSKYKGHRSLVLSSIRSRIQCRSRP